MATYTRKTTVEAVQFLVDSLPWPSGVEAVAHGGYAACYPELNLYFPIQDGDYIVATANGPKIVPQAEFQDEFIT